jgi:hypothetical protein
MNFAGVTSVSFSVRRQDRFQESMLKVEGRVTEPQAGDLSTARRTSPDRRKINLSGNFLQRKGVQSGSDGNDI